MLPISCETRVIHERTGIRQRGEIAADSLQRGLTPVATVPISSSGGASSGCASGADQAGGTIPPVHPVVRTVSHRQLLEGGAALLRAGGQRLDGAAANEGENTFKRCAERFQRLSTLLQIR